MPVDGAVVIVISTSFPLCYKHKFTFYTDAENKNVW